MVVALAGLMPLIILTAVVRLGRSFWRARYAADLAGIVLAVACRHLPADRADWGAAMRAELTCIDSTAARRSFAIGAIRATVTARLMNRNKPILGGVTACAGLSAAVLISHPGLRGSPHVPLLLVVLAVTLTGYAALAAATATIPWWSIAVGGAIAVTWFVFDTGWWDLHGMPLVFAALLPMLAGAITARRTGSTRAGVIMAIRSGLIGGVAVFIAVTIDALAAGGSDTVARTSTAGEGLAIGALFLLLVPCLTVAAGTVGAVVGTIATSRRYG